VKRPSAWRIISIVKPWQPASRRVLSLALVPVVIATLLLSVIIPAFEMQRVSRLLREITEIIEPARNVSWQLESGLAMEYSALQGYALSGDSVLLARYRAMVANETRQLATLEELSTRLGPEAVRRATAVRHEIAEWQELNLRLFDGRLRGAPFEEAARIQRMGRDAIIREIDRLPSQLSGEAATRLEQVAEHERRSLFVNAFLVMLALAAIGAVVSLSLRERRLAAALRRRVEEESAMAQMARKLSEAITIEDAARRILEGTIATMHSIGAYLEIVSSDGDAYRSAALVGAGGEFQLQTHDELSASVTEDTRKQNASGMPHELRGMERWLPSDYAPDCVHCTGLVVPLLAADELFGVLVLLRDARAGSFTENERSQMRLIGDLAAAVIRRVDVERLALVEMQQRAMYETALREAAEALAGAFTVDDVTQQIAESALEATQARGAFVEIVTSGSDGAAALVVRGAAGADVPAPGTTRAYGGSFTEHAIDQEEPALVADFEIAYPSFPLPTPVGESSPTIILPLGHSRGPIGALFIVGARPTQFHADDTGWTHTLAHLATLAYEKVRLLDESREGREALERVMKSRQRLLRGFSHDVKNPLGAADGYADLLSAGIYGELAVEQKESVQRIRRSIRRALDLIDDLHELARAETGNIALRRTLVDIGDLARTSADEYRGAAYASGLPLTVDIADDLPSIETDSARVRQIVGNLLSNAIKYTRTGAITIRVRRHTALTLRSGPASVDIEVIDTGPGIPADKQEQIFEEFSRLGTSDKPGAGLGLAISKRLAEVLGGEIFVNSEAGCGSTFTFRIPASIPDESAPAAGWAQLVDDVNRARSTASTRS
jgi:signal transduction histidine kinase